MYGSSGHRLGWPVAMGTTDGDGLHVDGSGGCHGRVNWSGGGLSGCGLSTRDEGHDVVAANGGRDRWQAWARTRSGRTGIERHTQRRGAHWMVALSWCRWQGGASACELSRSRRLSGLGRKADDTWARRWGERGGSLAGGPGLGHGPCSSC
jgi:hypothetical protein